jgi:hypothetical protein
MAMRMQRDEPEGYRQRLRCQDRIECHGLVCKQPEDKCTGVSAQPRGSSVDAGRNVHRSGFSIVQVDLSLKFDVGDIVTESVGAGVQDESGRLSFVLYLESSHGPIPVSRVLRIINHDGSPQNKTSSASAAYLSRL